MKEFEQKISPRLHASCISRLFFIWLYDLFIRGRKRPLTIQDLPETLPEHKSEYLYSKFKDIWDEELSKSDKLSSKDQNGKSKEDKSRRDDDDDDISENSNSPSIPYILYRMFIKEFLALGIVVFLEEAVLKLGTPIFLGYLLEYLEEENHTWESSVLGVTYAVGMVVCEGLFVVCDHPCQFALQNLGMDIRITLTAVLYNKILRSSKVDLDNKRGELLNYFSVELNRFDWLLAYVHYIWVTVIQFIFSLVIISVYLQVGPAALVTIILVVLFPALQIVVGFLIRHWRRQATSVTSNRIRILSNIFSNMRVIKYYTWEDVFYDGVQNARKAEMDLLYKVMCGEALNHNLYYFFARLALYFTILTYEILNSEGDHGKFLTPKQVFVTFALYNAVQVDLTYFFPLAVQNIFKSWASMEKYEKYMSMAETVGDIPPETEPESEEDGETRGSSHAYVEMNNVFGAWSTNEDPVIRGINLSVHSGEIIGVTGPVASGKSSILQAISRELYILSGSIDIYGSVAYTTEEPWIMNASLKDNVIFGKKYDPEWFTMVIQACALEDDISEMEDMADTIVDMSSLSGGQRARVNLARAVYADADIYLLDDPLSSVDGRIAKHIFENCILGLLKDKAVILVTHQAEFMRRMSQVIIMAHGTIHKQGTFHSVENDLETLQKFHGRVVSNKSNAALPSKSELKIQLEESTVLSSPHIVTHTENKKDIYDVTDFNTGSLKVNWNLGIGYYVSGVGLCHMLLCLLGLIFWEVWMTITDCYLSYLSCIKQKSTQNVTSGPDEWTMPAETHLYGFFVISLYIISLLRNWYFCKISIWSSNSLHFRLFDAVMRAPVSIFDGNALGAIMTRFSRDLMTADETMPVICFDVMEEWLVFAGTIFIVAIWDYYMIIPAVLMILVFNVVRQFFIRTFGLLRALDVAAKTPVISFVNTTLNGIDTIRGLKLESTCLHDFYYRNDLHTSAFYSSTASSHLIGLSIDWCSILLITFTVISVFFTNFDGSTAGLILTSILNIVVTLQWGVRQSAEIVNQMIAVAKITQQSLVPPEAPWEIQEFKTSPDWPEQGSVDFVNLSLKYENRTVLSKINLKILPGQTIGVVGKSGAGKTSLLTALFRLAEPSEGYIEIDGIDTSKLGLKDLRSRIAVIPQEPVVFVGTIRFNLDPYNRHEDSELHQVLGDVHLLDKISSLPGGLDHMIFDTSGILTTGQKQLMCLARAILTKSHLLVLDEATANVDFETSGVMQDIINQKFKGCTQIAIAHRIDTVIQCDKALVMSGGKVTNFDEPWYQIAQKSGILWGLCLQLGDDESEELYTMAQNAYSARRGLMLDEGTDLSDGM